ncbi:MAG TPA: hypothetical protein VFH45_09765 [Acidimicrobiales bacterium]|nr:hypothetical protein [Acidimicrobiales bacterium]
MTASTDKFIRGSLPGEVTVSVHPGTWYDYRVEVATSTSAEGSAFAVGNFSVAKFQLPQKLGIGALLIANLGAAIVIAVAPRARRTRRRSGPLRT